MLGHARSRFNCKLLELPRRLCYARLMAKSKGGTRGYQRSPDAGDAALGPRIRETRLKLKMSQGDLAEGEIRVRVRVVCYIGLSALI